MSDGYTTLEKKIEGLPDSCLDEVSAFVDFMYFRARINKNNNEIDMADDTARMDAINDAFGLWSNHENSMSVDDTVRQMRKGRHFDF